METTVGSVIINDMLPEDLRDYHRVWDKKATKKTLTALAQRYPELYKDISHRLLKFGAEASYLTGGQSFGLRDISETPGSKDIRKKIEKETQDLLRRAYSQGKRSTDKDVEKQIVDIIAKYYPDSEKTLDEKKEWDSPFWHQAYGTGAQKPGTFKSMVGMDMAYQDATGRVIPMPITHGYSHGVTPAEYFAASFGARKGVIDLQMATSDAGFLAKQLVQIAHREVVTADDDDKPYDESMPIGYPGRSDDAENEGAFLAHPAGGYPRNTLLTPKILKDIKNKGIDNILVRSVTVGGPINGGVYAKDAGYRERGIPNVGDFVGISAVQSISEPLTQAAISCLHPDTEVRMGDCSVKKIKDIKVGDIVLGSDKQGYTRPVKVTHVFNNGVKPVYKTTYESKLEILSTLEHKILQIIDDEIKEEPIKFKGSCYTSDHRAYKFISQEFIANTGVLDIEVDHPDHMFVLANGMVVSNSKHSGGVLGADSAKGITGFKFVNQLIQVPKKFPHGTVHSDTDGKVDRIEEAPQGGSYVFVNGSPHYVKQGVNITVKPGDMIEAGDVLTEGIPNPALVVKYKGIGEGRRAFVNQFYNAMKDAGVERRRRTIEFLGRGLINYVRLNDEMGDYAPGDVLPYAMVTAGYEPRKGFQTGNPEDLKGMYLEKPVLHYTIGTKIRPSVIKMLKDYGIKSIVAHKDPPPFEPEMIRGMGFSNKDPDWGTRLLGGYNKDSLLEGARRGSTSYTEGTSFVPALAFGDADFGLRGAIAPPEVRKYEQGINKFRA